MKRLIQWILVSILMLPLTAVEAQRGGATLAERVAALEEQQGGGGSDLMLQLLDRVDSMQLELRELRGQLEQQAHQLEQLQRRQRDQYLDLDRRLQQGGVVGDQPAVVVPDLPVADVDDDRDALEDAPMTESVHGLPEVRDDRRPDAQLRGLGQTDVRVDSELVDPAAERRAYDAAFNRLRNGQYADAARDFRQFIENYPGGQFVDNARYWLGESYYVTRNYDLAKDAFEDVLREHPDGSKYPDAMLKLGFTHYELGNFDRARRFLEQVVEEYPDTTVSRLAEGRLRSMRLEGR